MGIKASEFNQVITLVKIQSALLTLNDTHPNDPDVRDWIATARDALSNAQNRQYEITASVIDVDDT